MSKRELWRLPVDERYEGYSLQRLSDGRDLIISPSVSFFDSLVSLLGCAPLADRLEVPTMTVSNQYSIAE